MSYESGKIARLSLTIDSEEPIKVLLIEDSRTIRAQLRYYLSLLDNVTLFEASSLGEARPILEKEAATLFCAILDLTLPDASGIDLVESVRGYGVPIIVLTASDDPLLRQAVIDQRVIDYMFKNGAAAIEDVACLIGSLRQNQAMKVMVVDDSQTFRSRMSALLAQYRFVILTAKNGREALERLDEHPDAALILTDHHMPEMDGLELVRRIRRLYRPEDLAIIALSDTSRPELSAAMLKAGANDYLSKRFEVEEFYCRVLQNINMVRFVRDLRDLANRDYLTRLHNRRYLFQQGERLYVDASAGKHGLAVAMVDADHFKGINDQYGHMVGDEALKKIAAVIRRCFSRKGIAARYGGEEFVCVITLDEGVSAVESFERMRAEIEAIDLQRNGQRIPLTASVGVATALGNQFADMIELADQALYRAKAAGRNRVMEASP